MKKAIILGLFTALSFLPVQAAMAQGAFNPLDYSMSGKDMKPQPSSPQRIAMIFAKLARKPPDFQAWARNTEAYKNAPDLDKPAVEAQQAEELKNIFSLMTLQEPLVVEMQAKLSKYSASNKGFFVESFKEETFFPARYAGESYAIIPEGIMDKQWLKEPDAGKGKEIEDIAARSGSGTLPLVLTLAPKLADGSTTAILDDVEYWLLAATIEKSTFVRE